MRAARSCARDALRRFAETLRLPVATTYHARGVFPDDHAQVLGAVGLVRRDDVNFGFDEADVIVIVGYELQEFDPVRFNPDGDKQIVHLRRSPAEVDAHYNVTVGVQADVSSTLDALAAAAPGRLRPAATGEQICMLLATELACGDGHRLAPLPPQRIVADTRRVLRPSDIALADSAR